MPFEKYKDLWELKENNFHRLELQKAAVLFMDCKDVTADHQRYQLMGKDPVYRVMADCARQVSQKENLSCMIYAGIDEASVVFPDSRQLYDRFRVDDCADYVLSLFTQRFLKLFWKIYPKIYVKSTIFPLSIPDIGRYLSYRKEVCQTVAAFYQAKEHLPSALYRDLPFAKEPVCKLLMEYDLYDTLVKNRSFYNGILVKCEPDSVLSHFADLLGK